MNPKEGEKIFSTFLFCSSSGVSVANESFRPESRESTGTHTDLPAVSVACRQIRQSHMKKKKKKITLEPNEAVHFFWLNSRRNDSKDQFEKKEKKLLALW
ncbi:hypothetical protein PVAP13_6KG272300 [Panicum virgatum]|uniref:Uncharacterized protein n=1 Tax=Panicum virgatum TaxID=38727 RepID=A0A8T0RDQ4_PANVG|nr:hypothetical protein PVAP13_6KG272300 [Panicum virgatum]